MSAVSIPILRPVQWRVCSITKNWDFSAFKHFGLTEDALQFRAEFFNFINTPVFGGPNTSVNNRNFGRITAQANAPRQIQFGLKLLW